jgi:hypothetical protein
VQVTIPASPAQKFNRFLAICLARIHPDRAFSHGMQTHVAAATGSKDGLGSGDHDQAYAFGRRPRAIAPFPFTPRQFGRLLALRGRIADGLIGHDDREAFEDASEENDLAEAVQAQHDALDD